MSIIFVDSFDHYATANLALKYSGGGALGNFTVATAAARTGLNGLKCTTGTSNALIGGLPSVTFTASTHVIVGFALQIVNMPGTTTVDNVIVGFADSWASSQYGTKIVLTSTGQLRMYKGIAAQTDNWTGTALTAGVWYYVEVKAKYVTGLTSSVGDVEIRIDYGSGPTVVNQLAATQSTSAGVHSGFTNFGFGDSSTGATGWATNQTCFYIDDVYALDITGGTNTNYLGNCTIECKFATAAGASASWTPNSGTNFSRVNETAMDGDTSYVSTSTTSARDSYAMGDLTTNPTNIFGVVATTYMRRDAAETTRTADMSLHIGSTYYDGSATPDATGIYVWYHTAWELSPATSAAFTATEFNGLEAGIKLVS